MQKKAASPRVSLGDTELDRVLGGGLVPGCFVLLGGEPGIGKSTLTLQLAARLSGSIIASGEESAEQIARRAHRLGVHTADVHIIADTHIDAIIAAAEQASPRYLW